MTKKDATKLAKQLRARFEVYFKNTYTQKSGKHWQARSPEGAAHVALNSIGTTCEVARVSNSVPSTYAFRFDVFSEEPKFVQAMFCPTAIKAELTQFFHGKLGFVYDVVDLRKGELFLCFKEKSAKQYYHFQFRDN